MTIRAYPTNDGLLRLDGERQGETYQHRERIKAAGGRWDPDRKHWTVTDEQRQALGYERMVHCHVQDTHCKGKDWFMLPESQAVVGTTHRGFCGHCDSRSDLEVIEVCLSKATP